METYRDDFGALREQVEALKLKLEETTRSLEDAHAQASTHKRAAQAFETELRRTRRAPVQRWGTLATAALLGLAFGVIVESGVSKGRLKSQQIASDLRLAHCESDLSDARSHR